MMRAIVILVLFCSIASVHAETALSIPDPTGCTRESLQRTVDKYLDAVKSVQVGDRIAIKSSYTRKKDLPFDNRDQTVSVMAIKAIGIITEC